MAVNTFHDGKMTWWNKRIGSISISSLRDWNRLLFCFL